MGAHGHRRHGTEPCLAHGAELRTLDALRRLEGQRRRDRDRRSAQVGRALHRTGRRGDRREAPAQRQAVGRNPERRQEPDRGTGERQPGPGIGAREQRGLRPATGQRQQVAGARRGRRGRAGHGRQPDRRDGPRPRREQVPGIAARRDQRRTRAPQGTSGDGPPRGHDRRPDPAGQPQGLRRDAGRRRERGDAGRVAVPGDRRHRPLQDLQRHLGAPDRRPGDPLRGRRHGPHRPARRPLRRPLRRRGVRGDLPRRRPRRRPGRARKRTRGDLVAHPEAPFHQRGPGRHHHLSGSPSGFPAKPPRPHRTGGRRALRLQARRAQPHSIAEPGAASRAA